MSFIKNPFRKSVPAKTQPKSANPANGSNQAQVNNKSAKAGTSKPSLPNNYLDPNSVF
ncbi:hypothetical protein [Kaarinaea lacus]